MPAKILSVLLIVQAALFYALARREPGVAARPLGEFPPTLAGWRMLHDSAMDEEVKETLRADDYLNRDYSSASGRGVNLFIAFFKSQRAGQTPHSPKNCLPGSGWMWSVSDTVPVALGRGAPVEVNRYIVSKGDDKAAVFYWYQSGGHVIASEYRAAAWTAWDALRYNRTDTALIRVVVPITRNQERAATETGLAFVHDVFPTLGQFLPQ